MKRFVSPLHRSTCILRPKHSRTNSPILHELWIKLFFKKRNKQGQANSRICMSVIQTLNITRLNARGFKFTDKNGERKDPNYQPLCKQLHSHMHALKTSPALKTPVLNIYTDRSLPTPKLLLCKATPLFYQLLRCILQMKEISAGRDLLLQVETQTHKTTAGGGEEENLILQHP